MGLKDFFPIPKHSSSFGFNNKRTNDLGIYPFLSGKITVSNDTNA
jgi:hypothetical protein